MNMSFFIYDNGGNKNPFPAGPAYLAAVLRNRGYKVSMYHQNIYHNTEEEVKDYYKKNYFDVIGIGFVAGYYQYKKIRLICEALNSLKRRPVIVLGGHGPTPAPEFFLRSTNADIVVLGEGEIILSNLLSALDSNQPLSTVEGIAYREGEKVYINKRSAPVKDLDTIPFPAWDLFPMEHYALSVSPPAMKSDRQMRVITTRGCPYHCNFCFRLEKGVRMRSVEGVIEEIKILKRNYYINYIFFLDELFMISKKRVFEICEQLIKENLNIKFSCTGRLNTIDEDMLGILKKAGCVCISYGIESGNQEVLNKMDKKITLSQIHRGLQLTIDVGIHPMLNMLFGHIGDNAETLQQNLDILLKYNTNFELRALRPPAPYPGTPLYNYAIEKGLLKGVEDFYKKHTNVENLVVNFTELSDDEFYRLLFDANCKLTDCYYNHTAEEMKQSYSKVYFEGDVSFRGPRFLTK